MAVDLVGVLDTSILLRAGLMAFLTSVASTDAFLPRWSDEIQQEWEERLSRRPEKIHEALRQALVSVPDAVLPVSVDDLAASKGLCEADDQHVLAAAFCARRLAGVEDVPWTVDATIALVTGNLKDFDVKEIERRKISVLDADAFGLTLLRGSPLAVLRTIQREPRERYARYLERMGADGLTRTAAKIDALIARYG